MNKRHVSKIVLSSGVEISLAVNNKRFFCPSRTGISLGMPEAENAVIRSA
jgi:hypothetical protein